MSAFVLDNSVSMRWLLASENAEDQAYAESVLLSLTSKIAVVPNLWHLEAINVLLAAQKREEIDPDVTAQFLIQLQGLGIQLDPSTASKAFSTTAQLAKMHNLSSYDAAYLELAIRETIPIATLDKKLKKAAQNANVRVYLANE